jgi:PAS domain S-box-containing protein
VLFELRETEARQRALLAAIPDLMFRLRRDGTYLEFAGDLTRLATPAGDLVGANMHEILPAEIAGPLMACAERALDTGELQSVEYRLRTYGGELCDFEARLVPVQDSEDEVVTIVRDVTASKRVEQERREAAVRLAEAAGAERSRLERNLHDGAQQRLVTANLHLQLAQRELDQDPPRARAFLVTAQAELEGGLADIRQLAHGLDPPILVSEGLGSAVRALVANSTVSVTVDELPAARFPAVSESVAYYVVAEALANAFKHADAGRIGVSACAAGGELVVTVTDDGVGDADAAGGTGLRGLAERVAAVGGTLEVESPPGGGTVVRALIPTLSE